MKNRPDHLARRTLQSGMDRSNLVPQGELGRELRIELIVGLRIVADQFNLLAEQTTLAVDLIDREIEAALLLRTERLQEAGKILNRAEMTLSPDCAEARRGNNAAAAAVPAVHKNLRRFQS